MVVGFIVDHQIHSIIRKVREKRINELKKQKKEEKEKENIPKESKLIGGKQKTPTMIIVNNSMDGKTYESPNYLFPTASLTSCYMPRLSSASLFSLGVTSKNGGPKDAKKGGSAKKKGAKGEQRNDAPLFLAMKVLPHMQETQTQRTDLKRKQ